MGKRIKYRKTMKHRRRSMKHKRTMKHRRRSMKHKRTMKKGGSGGLNLIRHKIWTCAGMPEAPRFKVCQVEPNGNGEYSSPNECVQDNSNTCEFYIEEDS